MTRPFNIAILGAAESGIGAAILAQKQGLRVFVSDKGTIKQHYKSELEQYGIEYEEGKHSTDRIMAVDEVVKSPGIPDKVELLQQLRQKGVPVISEIEFAYRYTDAEIIGITGSNGKSTTTSLTYHIFKKAGFNVGLAGNIGHSFARQVALENYGLYVLEISSFQLDDIRDFRPHVAVLLNITPDHLDRYNYDFQNYIDSKFRIAENQTSDDYFIYYLDDAVIVENLATHQVHAKQVPFSAEKQVKEGAHLLGDDIIFNLNKNSFAMSKNDLALSGKHNVINSMASGIVGRAYEIRKDFIREGMQDFNGLEHRLEHVTKVSGVEFINDSKGTNVNSTWYALESMSDPVIWIAGGVDKGNDYECLKPLVSKKVKAIVCLGIENLRIHEAFGNIVDVIVNTQSMKEAVQMAHHLANPNEVVLLSPACASFDLYENYEDRGNQFKAAVREL